MAKEDKKMYRWSLQDDIEACKMLQAGYPGKGTEKPEWDKIADTLSFGVSGRAVKDRINLLMKKFVSEDNLNARRYVN